MQDRIFLRLGDDLLNELVGETPGPTIAEAVVLNALPCPDTTTTHSPPLRAYRATIGCMADATLPTYQDPTAARAMTKTARTPIKRPVVISTINPRLLVCNHYGGRPSATVDLSTRRDQTGTEWRFPAAIVFRSGQLPGSGIPDENLLPAPFQRRRLCPLMTQPHTPASQSAEIADATRRRAQQRRAFADAIGHIHDQHDEPPVAPPTEPIAPTQTDTASETPPP